MYKIFALAVLLSIWTYTDVTAQQFSFRTAEQGAFEMIQIPGGLLMVEGESAPRIANVISPGGSTIDLQEGDQIIYINGEKVTTLANLANGYKTLSVGEEVQLGIQRGEEKMIRSFEKPSKADLEKQGIVFRTETSTMGPGLMDELSNPSPWPAGFLIGENANGVIIGMALPLPDKHEALEAIQEGDVIASLNGKAVKTVAQFIERYDAIAVGDEVVLVVSRGEEEMTISLPRPEDQEIQIRMN